MKNRFHVTYSIVTPESAELGDHAETGYARPHGWRFPVETTSDADIEACAMTLREALAICSPQWDEGSWFGSEPQPLSYRDGSDISYGLHPDRTVTGASYRRIGRLLRVTK